MLKPVAPDDGLTGGDAHHPIGSMTRAQALRAITYHVAAGDMAMATRVYCENRIGRRAFDEAVAKGQQLAAAVRA